MDGHPGLYEHPDPVFLVPHILLTAFNGTNGVLLAGAGSALREVRSVFLIHFSMLVAGVAVHLYGGELATIFPHSTLNRTYMTTIPDHPERMLLPVLLRWRSASGFLDCRRLCLILSRHQLHLAGGTDDHIFLLRRPGETLLRIWWRLMLRFQRRSLSLMERMVLIIQFEPPTDHELQLLSLNDRYLCAKSRHSAK
jgi:hypothetical protein